MSISTQQMAARVAELLELRLRARGDGLTDKLRRCRRHLPRHVLEQAEYLAMNAEAARVPRLRARIDPQRTAEAYDVCLRYLRPLGAGARRARLIWSIIGSIAAATVLTVALLATVLVWRGFV